MIGETSVTVNLKEGKAERIKQWFYFIFFPLVLIGISIYLVIDTGYFGIAIVAFTAGTRMPFYLQFTREVIKNRGT